MQFNRLTAAFAGTLVLGLVAESLLAQTARQTVTFRVVPMSRVAVSGPASPVIVGTATASRALDRAPGRGASYTITTNESNQKIAASLDAPMPSGVSLAVSLAAPAGAVSAGSTDLGTASADVVTGISGVSATALPIVYTLSASADTAVAPRKRVVTFTITAGQ